MYTPEDLRTKIDATKAMIEAYEAAILALASGAQMYSLDTGQTRQTVQRAQLASLNRTLALLEQRLATLCRLLSGTGVYARPGF